MRSKVKRLENRLRGKARKKFCVVLHQAGDCWQDTEGRRYTAAELDALEAPNLLVIRVSYVDAPLPTTTG